MKRIFKDYIIWEMKAEDDAVAAVVVEHPDEAVAGDGPTSAPAEPEKRGPGSRLREKLGDEEQEPVQLPNAAVAVARATSSSLRTSISWKRSSPASPSAQRLENDGDFQRVNDELKKLGARKSAFATSPADEQFHITYDLFKAGKLPESETVLAQIIRSAQEEDSDAGPRKPKFDGSKLPDYQVARRYLGIGGTYAATEENGWIVVGFLFPNDAAEKNLAAAATERTPK